MTTQERLRGIIDMALRKTSVAKAHSHPYSPRVFFIDEAHRAGAKTQETLLKDIEDHQEAVFILSTTQPDKLDPACEYVVQNEWTEYTGLLEEGCDAALFVAMHAKAGTPDGVLAHTVSGQSWRQLKFNGSSVGETGINAALCGHWGCPVLLVTGDEAVCREARELLGDGLTTVAVKKGLGSYSARQLPPLKAREVIEEGARRALKDLTAVKPYDPGRPAEIQIEFHTPARLVEYRNRKGVEQLDEHTLVSRADDWWAAWSQFFF